MVKKLDFLAIVPDKCKDFVVFRAYFICKKTKQLIAIEVEPKLVDFCLKKEDRKKRILKLAKILQKLKIKKIIIEKSGSTDYKTTLKTKNRFLHKSLTVSFYSGFIASRVLNIPLEIESKTLRKEGIYITQELLKTSLN